MKTRWIRTETGLYMEIFEPEWSLEEVLKGSDLTDEEMVEAMRRYVEKRYKQPLSEYEQQLAAWEGEGGSYHDDGSL